MRNLRLWWALYGPTHPLESALAWLGIVIVPAASLAAHRMGWASFYSVVAGWLVAPTLIVLAVDDMRRKRGAPPVRLRFR